MKVHELALFWRDLQSRSLTLTHFIDKNSPAEKVARRIAETLDRLSLLQLYGLAINGEPIEIASVKPVPAYPTAHRLELSLFPDEDLNPRYGVTLINLAIPEPTD